jgi:predicted RNA-binding protein YlqC (UPF0109 family)
MEDPILTVMNTIVKEIVDHPDKVVVRKLDGKNTAVVEIITAKDDVGKVIGKSGAMAKALRTICSSISGKHDRRYMIQIVE